MLVLIPETVDYQLFTLKSLAELIKKPKQGNATQFRTYYPKGNENLSVANSYWVLMTRDVLEGTRKQTYSNQVQIVSKFCEKTGVDYQAPKLLEAATCIFMEYVSKGTRLYGDNPKTLTRCQEKSEKSDSYQMVVGGFAPAGLIVDYRYGTARIGVAVLRKS